ncbi:MAG TPA: serine/threonine-protein kinase [Polyangia bacterium]|nr:serine/threonine-protein kinase [Polyangia bacterium]
MGVGPAGKIPAYARQFGKYTLLAKLATGGMAEILLARLHGAGGFEKRVVLKRLLPQFADDEQFVAMFLDEARIAARISHPNVCQVYELGEQDGQHFIAMEYLDGVPLAAVMRKASRDQIATDIRFLAGLVVQACEGLHHAHELTDQDGHPLGLVHRDISPQNLFVTVDGVVKVLDFGVAKEHRPGQKTRTGTVKGKYAYMAPEQLRGEPIDRRADIFSLGVVVFEAVTGRRLFWRETEFLIFRAITDERIPLASELRPGIPDRLEAAISCALARDREERFPTARAFGEAVSAAVTSLGGPWSHAALARHVQRMFADDLAEQRAVVARAAAECEREAAEKSADDAAPLAMPHTDSLRVEVVVEEEAFRAPARPRVRAGTVGLALVAALTGALAVYLALRKSAPPAQVPVTLGAAAGVHPAPPAPSARPEAAATVSPASASPKRAGYITIDSTPYATIYIDGKNVGDTPLFRLRLPAGRHAVRAVSPNGRVQNLTITVPSGHEAPARRLTW